MGRGEKFLQGKNCSFQNSQIHRIRQRVPEHRNRKNSKVCYERCHGEEIERNERLEHQSIKSACPTIQFYYSSKKYFLIGFWFETSNILDILYVETFYTL